MKFSVEVETESRLYERVGLPESPSPRHLTWNIQVDIQQKINLEKENLAPSTTPAAALGAATAVTAKTSAPAAAAAAAETAVPARKSATTNSKFSMKRLEPVVEVPTKAKRVGEEMSPMRERKQSRLDREEELVRRAISSARHRKVSREGEWLVFREKVGILTTQNGTQEIREKRVKITERDLSRLEELGF